MKCPSCGNELAKGKVMIRGRISYSYWAEDEYFEKHPVNPSYRLYSSIEKDGGVVLELCRDGLDGSALDDPPDGWYCRGCGLLVTNARGRSLESDEKMGLW